MTVPRCTWQTLDWPALDRMRGAFLSGDAAHGPYWHSLSDLANYDFTFAQRIGWKWDAVLGELRLRGWTPPRGPLADWGCGSGVAARAVLDFYGAENFEALRLSDHSPLAMEFAAARARERFPQLSVEMVGLDAATAGTLVVSHVINELDEAGRRGLRRAIDLADVVLWVEPGTHADSRALIAMREALREQFHVIAPCTHPAACGMLATGNERHWCHHFAEPPAGIMADADWVNFAQRAGVDLRSLPYSFLVLERRGLRAPVPGQLPDGWSHLIGAPRLYKGFARVFSCQAAGVRELEMQKRDAPAVFKAMHKGRTAPVYRWEIASDRIKTAQALESQSFLTPAPAPPVP